jgi:hydrogenase maturation protease
MKTIVVGLGNPILGDDGIGWKVAEEVGRMIKADASLHFSASHPGGSGEDIEVDRLSIGGLGLMERLVGYDYAILVDALALDYPPGSVHTFSLDELPSRAGHAASAHDTSLQNALRLGRSMGAHLPDRVTVVGVTAQPVFDFGEELSPLVRASVGAAARTVLDLLNEIV